MSSNIQGNKLLVISDSPVCKGAGGYVAFEPVVRELESLAPLFDEIVWLACKAKPGRFAMRSPAGSVPINIIAMPGVLHRYNVLRMLILYPLFAYYLLRFSRSATHIHTRGPSHPALLGILLPMLLKRHYWHKYAGNWIESKLALSFKLQKSILKSCQKSAVKVTVNGAWPDSPSHVLSFENPCISEGELLNALTKAANKTFSGKLNLLFVGNLTRTKGVLQLIEAAETEGLSDKFEHLYIVGDGELKGPITQKLADWNGLLKIQVLGSLSRAEINRLYEQCHVLILPSESEGFPKVVAEGAAFGCIPVVTNISSISQYVQHAKNGYLLTSNSSEEIYTSLNYLANSPSLPSLSKEVQKIAAAFTYERFVHRIKTEVFDLE